jgi:hypothetical protein
MGQRVAGLWGFAGAAVVACISIEISACSAILGIGEIPEAGDIPDRRDFPIESGGSTCEQVAGMPVANVCPGEAFIRCNNDVVVVCMPTGPYCVCGEGGTPPQDGSNTEGSPPTDSSGTGFDGPSDAQPIFDGGGGDSFQSGG